MFQIINEPTYFTEHSSSLLDIILVSDHSIVEKSSVGDCFLDQYIRYHCPTYGLLSQPALVSHCFKRNIWLFSAGDYVSYRQNLANVDWDSLLDESDINKSVSNFNKTIVECAKLSIPNKSVIIRQSDPQWINNAVRKLIRKRRRLYNRAKRTKKDTDWEKYRRIRNQCVSLVRKIRDDYYNKLSADIDTCNDPKKWWKIVNKLTNLNSKKSFSNIPLLFKGKVYEDDNEKAEIFNNYFLDQSSINEQGATLPSMGSQYNSYDILSELILEANEIETVLLSLDTSKATGPDLLNPRLLKEAASILKLPMCKLFNMSLKKCIFPMEWKRANVTLIFKKRDKNNVSNYRPISLISITGKVMERCIFNRVNSYLTYNNFFCSNQSGFIRGDSTTNQLLDISNDIGKALDSGKEVRAVFCDISKAFDRVWHKGLLFKLRQAGIDGNLLNWFKNYLSNREQRVTINSTSSTWGSIKAGVPQGSILGPLLFLIYINDIVSGINCAIKLFADDTTLYIVVENALIASQILNNDLNKISVWATQWLVDFNPSKTECLLFSNKRIPATHPPLYMDGQSIKNVESHKHLGIHFSNNGHWDLHITLHFYISTFTLNEC